MVSVVLAVEGKGGGWVVIVVVVVKKVEIVGAVRMCRRGRRG